MIEDWVELCQNGQAWAYAEVVKAMEQKIVGFLFRMTQDRHWAEDLGQEVFLRAYQRLHQYNRSKAAFSTWLFTLARNLCLDRLRKHQPHWVELEEAAGQTGHSNPHSTSADLELERLIAQAVQTLEPAFREVFILREYEGLTLDEIAEITNIPNGTVKSRLHRARLILQERLQPVLHSN